MKFIVTTYLLLLFASNIVVAQSQVIKGLLKATPKNSITILPYSTELKSPIIEKSIADIYPPLNYTVPVKTDLKAKTLKPGTKVIATKKNPIIIEPSKEEIIDSTLIDSSNLKLIKLETKKDDFGQSIGILDPLDKIDSTTLNNVSKTIGDTTLTTKENSTQKSTTINTKNISNKEPLTKNTPISIEDKYLVEAKPTENKTDIINKETEKKSGTTAISTPNTNPLSPPKNDKQKIVVDPTKQDYKFFVSPDGKFNIVFTKDGNSISVTNFGRVAGVTFSSVNGDNKPIYNYRGLVETVGTITIQYNYEGRVSKINEYNITYNFNGNIDLMHVVPIAYNVNGSADKIDNSKIQYDFNGAVSSIDSNPLLVLKQ